MGLLDRLKARLTRTRTALSDGVSGLFRGGRAIDTELLGELEELLYTCDLGPVAAEVTAELARLHKRGEVKGEDDVRAALRRILLEKVNQETHEIDFTQVPTVILVVGVNGSGKTTSIAKLGERYRKMGKQVLLGAGDTFRAAAADQLEIWAQRNGAQIVRQKSGADPAAVAYDAVDAGIARKVDVVIVDTAGRLHTQDDLMAELTKVRRVIAKQLPGAPHETLLTVDATTGQNGLRQARLFSEAVEVTGIALTKLDGTAKGGIALAIAHELGIPVKLIGIGETVEDLRPFDADDFAAALLSG